MGIQKALAHVIRPPRWWLRFRLACAEAAAAEAARDEACHLHIQAAVPGWLAQARERRAQHENTARALRAQLGPEGERAHA